MAGMKQAWDGQHIANKAQFRYGSADDYGRLAKIESTVELSAQEVARIEDSIAKYGARFAIVRPAPRDPTHLDVEFRGGRPFERIRRIPDPEEEINLHIREETAT